MKIRSSVKALIIRDKKLLTIKKEDEKGYMYILPGGGQEFGETLIDAVRREVREEVGASISNENIVFVREYIGANHENALTDKDIHVVEHIFSCELEKENIYELEPDEDQVGIEWIDINELDTVRFFPKDLVEKIRTLDYTVKNEFYVGDLN
ncbi:NUDIX domain-containing protein [Oceanirhabdus sp. W0125-5]|uniref:NUDIX domain-containing protein n=1 Tax=Oceanirhabdus sp. W0125-5 TaxID=2999116 RepID=UPI0022F3216E|nr:NUDIX domain-containing protein [Oceanirhabdus sp. W0125-5]WBW94718.1 NUDIX domain-containing protein [Oceanirhabdus sp. W0125-5]